MRSFLITLAVAAIAAAPPATLEGSGVEVKIDLHGFEQDLGAGSLGKTYYRLGQFNLDSASARSRAAGKPLVVSVLVDDVPSGVGMDELRAHVLETTDPKPEVTATSAPPGFYFSYLQPISPQAADPKVRKLLADAGESGELTQWHLYFHTLHEGKWVELHFSSLQRSRGVDVAPLEKIALEVVRSLRVTRKRTKA